MTGPQQSRPTPAPRGDDPAGSPSPRPRHGRADEDFPENSYQTDGGSPDLRSSRPVERPVPSARDGYEDLYGGTGPQPVIDDPGGSALPGASAPGGAAMPGGYDNTGTGTPPHRAYGEYGDPASRGGTAIDGGPPYPASPAPRASTDTPGRGTATVREHGSTTAVSDRTAVSEHEDTDDVATPPAAAAAVPAQRGAPEEGRRPATVAEAAAARFGGREATPAGASGSAENAATGPAPGDDRQRYAAAPVAPAATVTTVAKDRTAITVLRVITYVLVSLSCLVFLAGVVYGAVTWLELREALGTSPLFGGGPMSGG